jgi:hypothetical protein
MTQIICGITQEYVLLASDRRLIYGSGPRKGQTYDDDTCKLVSLCGTTGIAYSGVGEMEGNVPTHHWIAKTLANERCLDAPCAERALIAHAPLALNNTPSDLRHHTFLLAGWAYFGEPAALRPYIGIVTNTRDSTGKFAPKPLDVFNASRRYLREEEEASLCLAGETLTRERAQSLERNLKRLLTREIGPKEALRLLVDEVINTSRWCDRVGSKILGFCIPKKGAQRFFESGENVTLASLPNAETTSFSYFEEGYSEFRQYGPTTVCGEWAVTDVQAVNDPARDFQSSSIRILALPKPNPTNGKSRAK